MRLPRHLRHLLCVVAGHRPVPLQPSVISMDKTRLPRISRQVALDHALTPVIHGRLAMRCRRCDQTRRLFG